MPMKDERMTSDTLFYESLDNTRNRNSYGVFHEPIGRDGALSGRDSTLSGVDQARLRPTSAASYSSLPRRRPDSAGSRSGLPRHRPGSSRSYRDRVMYRTNSAASSQLDNRLVRPDSVTSRCDSLTSCIDGMTSRVDGMKSRVDDVKSRIDDDGVYRPGSSLDDDDDDDDSVLPFYPNKSYGGSVLTDMSSVFSMSEDDFDRIASRETRELFDKMDAALFEGADVGSQHLTRECEAWRSNFPHLRVLGKQLCPTQDLGYQVLHTDLSDPVSQVFTTARQVSQLSRLCVSGQKIPSGPPPSGIVSPTIPDVLDSDKDLRSRETTTCSTSQPTEEIYEQNGSMEEILAIDYQQDVDDDGRRTAAYRSSRGLPPVTPCSSLRHSVIDVIADSVFKQVIAKSSPVWQRFIENVNPEVERRQIDLTDPRLRSVSRVAAAAAQLYRLDTVEDFELESSHAVVDRKEPVKRKPSVVSIERPKGRKLPVNDALSVISKRLITRDRPNNAGQVDNRLTNHRPSSSSSNVYSNIPAYKTSLNRPRQSHNDNLTVSQEIRLKNLNLEGLRLSRQSTEQSLESLSTRTPRILPPIPQRKISEPSSATNININQSLEARRRLSIRSNSTLHEREISRLTPLREQEKISSVSLLNNSLDLLQQHRPSTMQSYRSDTSFNRRTSYVTIPQNSVRRSASVSQYHRNAGVYRSFEGSGGLNITNTRRYRNSRLNASVR